MTRRGGPEKAVLYPPSPPLDERVVYSWVSGGRRAVSWNDIHEGRSTGAL
jgi:hypothetical protein